jgi:hypothetical protein
MKKLWFAVVVLSVCAAVAHADSLVTVRPTGTDSVDWSQLGAPGSQIPVTYDSLIYSQLGGSFIFTTANGVSGAGQYIGSYTGGDGSVQEEGVGGYFPGAGGQGNFAPGDFLNDTDENGPIILTFASGFTQIGAQIDGEIPGPFTAQICDNSNNACFTEVGESTSIGDDSAIYIGIASSTPITSVTFSLTSVVPYHPHSTADFAINEVTLGSIPVSATPEPGSLLLVATGLGGLAAAFRKRFDNHSVR